MKRLFAPIIALAIGTAPALASDWNPLLDPAGLESLRSDAPLILDIRAPRAKGDAPSYAAGHIEGAVSAPYGWWRGPKDNPGKTMSDEALTTLLQTLGVEKDRPTVVVHQGKDGTDFGAAARVYWTLKSSGVSQIAILNGGVNAWVAAEKPLTKEITVPEPSTITASLSDTWLASRDDIEAVLAGTTDATLLDARPARQFLGFSKHKAAKAAGHLPGAVNFSQAQWFDHNGALMSVPAQAAAIAQSIGSKPDEDIVSYCNTGHWAATNWFALSELAGYRNVKMYPGSMVEWTGQGGEVVTQ